ncbi:unnamed protein product [Spirodela intermedia]|uniref:Uncharacterized protein n=1 Tax=Spirodela intermedia TaxID=51605 RepID=A0A7I8JZI1_SPIIN|nr:unnamed protein product [Spirodela intermedia]
MDEFNISFLLKLISHLHDMLLLYYNYYNRSLAEENN